MSVAALARITRAIEDLERALLGMRHREAQRLALKSELEALIQRIDEIRQRL